MAKKNERLQCVSTKALFCFPHSIVGETIWGYQYPWEVLGDIQSLIKSWIPSEAYEKVGNDCWVHKSVTISSTATVLGPCIIGKNTELRAGAFIRENVIVGENCVVGNSTEVKNSILFDGVQIPHFNYVGDSVLGYRSHIGAGGITSNVKADKTNVVVKGEGVELPTKRKKVGAFLGDFVEVGCNCVLNPATVVGRNSTIYPLSSVRGIVPKNSIYKAPNNIVKKEG